MKSMRNSLIIGLFLAALVSCQNVTEKFGAHYQNNKDIESLKKVVELIDIGTDTAIVRKILGEPIDFGFDYRYLSNTIGENGCPVGAVFGIDSNGKISSKNLIEICE